MVTRSALVVATFLFVPAYAWAISVTDLIELSRAGVADEVLVELIGLDTAQPAPTTAEMLDLQEAAVSRPVLVAFLKNARRNVPPEGVDAPRVWDGSYRWLPADTAPVEVVVAPSQVVTVQQAPAPAAVPVYVPFYMPIWGTPAPAPAPHSPTRANVPTAPTLDQQPGFGRFMNTGWRPGPPPSVWDVGRWQR